MKKLLLQLVLLLHITTFTQAQTPKREFRGAWVATYSNIDWPVRSQTPAQQQAALRTILDHHKATGINAVFLQVRSQADAMYQSQIEPISADLTGVQGRQPNPVWDPLQFAIEEAHARGMELHAWLNPYRVAGNANNIANFAANHVAKQHPEWLLSSGSLRTLDPALPAVREYIATVITDIVSRYDVDGIHFDDYFYPSGSFNDDASFAAHSRGFSNRANWRRDNVNLLVKLVYETILSIKPWVEFGISPSGIYRNSTNPAIGSNTGGMEHYSALYADSRKWLQEGWIDYLAPQVYWYIGQSNANYAVLIPWWNNNAYDRLIYIGLAGYKVNDSSQGAPWLDPSQIPDQVRMTRLPAYPNVQGQIVYNTNSLRSSFKLGFRDSLRLDLYSKPALHPRMPWRDDLPPAKPIGMSYIYMDEDSVTITWTPPAENVSEFDKVRQYAVYRSETEYIDVTDPNQLIAVTNTAEPIFKTKIPRPWKNFYYAVTALDRFHNESELSTITKVSYVTSSPEADLQTTSSLTAFPNPFSNHITVQVTLPSTSLEATLEFYDVFGKMVMPIYTGRLEANTEHTFEVDATPLTGAVYFVRLVTNGQTQTFKMVKQ